MFAQNELDNFRAIVEQKLLGIDKESLNVYMDHIMYSIQNQQQIDPVSISPMEYINISKLFIYTSIFFSNYSLFMLDIFFSIAIFYWQDTHDPFVVADNKTISDFVKKIRYGE